MATLGLHGSRLSRQFQKALNQLREIQEAQRVRRAPPNEPGVRPRRIPFCAISIEDRRRLERRQLTEAAELYLRHQYKGLPWEASDHGFVFSKQQVERHAQYLMRLNPAFYATHPLFQSQSCSPDPK